jgi:hypothetical protein
MGTKIEIQKQMRLLQDDPSSLDSPVSSAVDLDHLRKSGSPEQRQIADLISLVSDLKKSILGMDSKLQVTQMALAHVLINTAQGKRIGNLSSKTSLLYTKFGDYPMFEIENIKDANSFWQGHVGQVLQRLGRFYRHEAGGVFSL